MHALRKKIKETLRLRYEATQGVWKKEECRYVESGWIDGVVDYEGCGSHNAKWEKGNLDLVIHAANNIGSYARALEVALDCFETMKTQKVAKESYFLAGYNSRKPEEFIHLIEEKIEAIFAEGEK